MRFTLEEFKKRAIDLGSNFRQWRATHVMPDGRSIQLYYWAADLVGAKQIVRNRDDSTVTLFGNMEEICVERRRPCSTPKFGGARLAARSLHVVEEF
jgi:hypothetical protein